MLLIQYLPNKNGPPPFEVNFFNMVNYENKQTRLNLKIKEFFQSILRKIIKTMVFKNGCLGPAKGSYILSRF